MTATGRLAGRRVLVPRGGEWGARVAGILRAEGADPVVAPLIQALPPEDPAALRAALADLAAGRHDWLVVTSAAAVDALGDTRPAPGTRVAAVGPATAEALRARGIEADLVPSESSAAALADAWPGGGRALVLASDLADPALAGALRTRGTETEVVVAYRTVSVALDAVVRDALRAGRIDAVLVTSGSVARSLADQAPDVAALIACLGPRTAQEARDAGLEVRVVAPERSAESLVHALAEEMSP